MLVSAPRAASDSESDSEDINWSSYITPARNMKNIGVYSSYIDELIQANITEAVDLTPSVSRAIEKRQKAMNIMVLDGIPAKEDLFKWTLKRKRR